MFGQEDNTVADTNKPVDSQTPLTNQQTTVNSASLAHPTNSTTVNDSVEEVTSTQDLLEIKEKALKELKPLVQHLDLSPEDKFKTTMMMIQASDNPSLLKSAYTVAQTLTDNEMRAQALLDIVNEINYFTHVNINKNN